MSLDLYFDYNGSTPVHPEVARRVHESMLAEPGNPSASHPAGETARNSISDARATIARGIGAQPGSAGSGTIWTTSGGTESNNWALFGCAQQARERSGEPGHLIVSSIEHKSVLSSARELERQGCALTLVDPRPDGALRAEDVQAALRSDTFLVSVMMANNETGVIQPVAAIGALCRERGIPFHIDAVCSLGRLDIDVTRLGCDMLSLSSHKLYAPKGCGILYLRDGAQLPTLIHGCGQQDGRRSGTENTPGILGFGAAVELMLSGEACSAKGLTLLRERLWSGLQARFPGVECNGSGELLPNTLNVHFPERPAGLLQAALGLRGISVGVGASASSGEPSHVLSAMGLAPERARCSLRFSLGAGSSAASIDALLEALSEILAAPLPVR